jgi:hypothetical protein
MDHPVIIRTEESAVIDTVAQDNISSKSEREEKGSAISSFYSDA